MNSPVPVTPISDRRRTHYDPRIDPRVPSVPKLTWVAGITALAFLVVAGVALAVQMLLYDVHMTGSALISAGVAGLLTFHISNGIRNRRKATARRLIAISELNHHVRNGLQQIAAVSDLHASGRYDEIQNAIDRIEWILTDCSTDIRGED